MDEVALAVQPVPAGDHLDAIGAALVDESHDAGELLGADQRAAHAALLVGAAELDEVGHVGDALDHLVVDPALDEDPRAADASLAGVDEDAHRRHEDGLVHVGVVVDQHGRLAAEFQHDLLEVARRRPHDLLADLGRPGERDLLDVGVRGDRRTRGVAVPGQQVDDAVRHAGLGDQTVEEQRRQRRLLGGLDDHAAARRERRRELRARVEDRPVPRKDQAHNAIRLLAACRCACRPRYRWRCPRSSRRRRCR